MEVPRKHYGSTKEVHVLPWCFRVASMRFHGASMVLPWDFRSTSVVPPWCFHGASMVLTWCVYGAYMVLSSYFSVMLPWRFRGDSMALQRNFRGAIIVISRYFRGTSTVLSGTCVGLPWDFHYASVRLPCFRGVSLWGLS